ncbi:hypothetical protein [Pontiella sp.]|uniref:hypothetical protein n=1 Tax=Pontiella sp. TaxID=2837462 RepID=UPI0035632EBE
MKSILLKWSIRSVAWTFLGLFVLGVGWSVYPLDGDTLPHRVEEGTGMSFGWSALLTSAVLGMLGVGAVGLRVVYCMIADDDGCAG